MLNWRKRLAEWRAVVREYGRGRYLGMVVAILSGPVPPNVWRARMRVCLRCPVLERERMICRRQLPDGRVLGCSCYTPALALTAAPYPRGCYAREITDTEGWPAYAFASWRAKVRALCGFFSHESERRKGGGRKSRRTRQAVTARTRGSWLRPTSCMRQPGGRTLAKGQTVANDQVT